MCGGRAKLRKKKKKSIAFDSSDVSKDDGDGAGGLEKLEKSSSKKKKKSSDDDKTASSNSKSAGGLDSVPEESDGKTKNKSPRFDKTLDQRVDLLENVAERLLVLEQLTLVRSGPQLLRTQLTIESNSLRQQNLIGYLIANLKPKLWEERASEIHIPSWKLHFETHLCS